MKTLYLFFRSIFCCCAIVFAFFCALLLPSVGYSLGCYCFQHCKCLDSCRDYNDLKSILKVDHEYPEDIAWHEFLKGMFQSFQVSTMWGSFNETGSYTVNIGNGFCVRQKITFLYDIINYDSSLFNYLSLSNYLNRIENFKLLLEKEKNRDIRDATRRFENGRKRPSDWQSLEKEINKQNRQTKAALAILNELYSKMVLLYANILESCPHKQDPSNFSYLYNRGFIAFLEGNLEEAFEHIHSFLLQVDINDKLNNNDKNTDFYRLYGEACLEVNLYHQAIAHLSKVLEKNPDDKKTYFSRAAAYFEIGEFDNALEDFIKSDKGSSISQSSTEVSNEFETALISSLGQGIADGTKDFLPSLCNSAYGLANCLWIGLNQPLESLQCFSCACSEIGKFAWEAFSKLDKDRLQEIYDINKNDLNMFVKNYEELNDTEKGQFLGYALGKGGIEILAGALTGTAAIKSMDAFRKLKNANRMCNLETMLVSNTNKEAVISSAITHSSQREAFFKNIKIEWDKQNKHVVGKHNFEESKGIFEHSEPQTLLSKFAGKGQPVNDKLPGMPDYRERVDFGEYIGYYVNAKNPNIKLPTTKGIIRYSKKGAHIVPSNPN